MSSTSDIGRALAAAARVLHRTGSFDETLQAVALAAREAVPGFDQVGISALSRSGELATKAAAGELVHTLDNAQYDLDEGPCIDALRGAVALVVVPRLPEDHRWPRYAPKAAQLGVRSQLGVRMALDEEGTVVGLNLYSTASADVSPEAESAAELFATHAGIALGNALLRENLNQALQSRKVIGQALGIVMERYEMNEDKAFAFLVRASSHANTKLRDIAQNLVDERNAG